MVEPYLRQSPLTHLALSARAQAARDDDKAPAAAGLVMAERPFRRILNLRGNPKADAFLAAAGTVLGTDLPLKANSATASDGVTLLWLGPDEWWAITEAGTPPLADRLQDAFSGQHTAVTEVGEGYGCIAVSGPRAADVLAKGSPLDFHDSVFAPGSCAQGDMAKATVVFHRLDDRTNPSFEIYVRSSFAEYLWRWIEDAAGEYGVIVTG